MVRVWTMRVGEEDGPVVDRWSAVLDRGEVERAARFVFPRHRVQFTAAHALARHALASATGAGAAEWRFVPDARGKPAAWLGDAAAPVAFSLSHTEGMVGVAVVPDPDGAVGFDLEATARRVPVEVAERFFHPAEVRWLHERPESARPLAFLRLWTLKEAFIKATGEGLSEDLASFWFELSPVRLRLGPANGADAAAWSFEQRSDLGGFVAALAVRRSRDGPLPIRWEAVDAAAFDPVVGARRAPVPASPAWPPCRPRSLPAPGPAARQPN